MILKCEVCGKRFEYDHCTGYSKEPPLCSVFCDAKQIGIRQERQRIIDEMVRPLMKYLTEVREYNFFNGDTFVHPFRAAIDKLLASVEVKLKEIKG